MKVLYSTQGAVEYDGLHYYGDSIRANYQRYLVLGDDITISCGRKDVENSKSEPFNNDVKFALVHKANTLKSYFKFARKNIQIIKESVREADIIVVHLPNSLGSMAVDYAKKYNKPYFVVVCGCPWDALWNHGWQGKLLAPFGFYNLRRVLKDAPYVIYVTEHFLQKRYPTSGNSIACSNANVSTGIEGVLEKRLAGIKERLSKKEILKIGTSAAVDVAYKGQEFVIRSVSQLKKKGLLFEYHIIGKGNPSRLQSIIDAEDVNDLVTIHGVLPHNQVLDFLDEMDIYIQPSKQEGLPRAMIEAMSRGCLCIGSNTAGIPELIDKKFVFPKGNVGRISSILEKITGDNLYDQAKRNYEEAKKYDRDLLGKRRKQFLLDFMESVQTK